MSNNINILVHRPRPYAGNGAVGAGANTKNWLGIVYGPDAEFAPAEVFEQERVVEVNAIVIRVMPRRVSVCVTNLIQGTRCVQHVIAIKSNIFITNSRRCLARKLRTHFEVAASGSNVGCVVQRGSFLQTHE